MKKIPRNRVRAYKQTATFVETARENLETEGKPAFIIAGHYGITGLFTFYSPTAHDAMLKSAPLVFCIDSEQPQNQFYFWPEYSYRASRKGQNAIYAEELGPYQLEHGWIWKWLGGQEIKLATRQHQSQHRRKWRRNLNPSPTSVNTKSSLATSFSTASMSGRVTICAEMAKILLRVRDYDLAATLDSGQVFRWREQNGLWIGVVGKNSVRLTQTNEGISAETAEPQKNWEWLREFLQTEIKLEKILKTFPDDAPMRDAVTACRGLRVLRIDPWECLASFILSSTMHIVQICCQIVSLSLRTVWRNNFNSAGRTVCVCISNTGKNCKRNRN